jgi:hypothetical protein
MNEHYYKRSEITNRNYDIFSSIRIISLSQAIFYIKKHVKLLDLIISQNKEGKDIFCFIFEKSEASKDAYILWRSYGEKENGGDENETNGD